MDDEENFILFDDNSEDQEKKILTALDQIFSYPLIKEDSSSICKDAFGGENIYFGYEETQAFTGDVLPLFQSSQEVSTENTKKKKAKGRLTKSEKSSLQGNELKGVHTKSAKDNIRRKIKVDLTQCICFFLNAIIKVEWNNHQKNKFRTLDNALTKNITINANAKLDSMTVKDFISQKVSKKFKCDPDQNQKTTEIILKLKPELFSPILNMKIGNFYKEIFCGNPKDIIEHYKLRNDKVFIKEKKFPKFFLDYCSKEKDDGYRKLYIEGVAGFFSYFQNTSPRNRRK